MDEIIASIQQCCLEIHDQMRTSLPTDTSTTTNSSGDQQKPLDLVTDQIITERLSHNKLVAGLLSEEQPDYRSVHTDGSYIISFDPLDGSGNSPLNLSTGSIFGIFQTSTLSTLSGQNLVGAVYAIYGSSLEIIVVTDSIQSRTVYLNTPSGREPKVLTDQITIPSNSKIFVANTGNFDRWEPHLQQYVRSLSGRSLRWMACFVADVHRLLFTGGVYLYPKDHKQPHGKLRLVYEVWPMSFIWEKCGGTSITDDGTRCLSLPFHPEQIHERSPIILLGPDELTQWVESDQ